MDNNTVSVDFKYIDECGHHTSMQKTVLLDYLGGDELDVLGDLFKDFLLAAGWGNLVGKRIKWVEDNR